MDAALVVNQLADELIIRVGDLHNCRVGVSLTIGVILSNVRYTLRIG
jgi:hypothetical protein